MKIRLEITEDKYMSTVAKLLFRYNNFVNLSSSSYSIYKNFDKEMIDIYFNSTIPPRFKKKILHL